MLKSEMVPCCCPAKSGTTVYNKLKKENASHGKSSEKRYPLQLKGISGVGSVCDSSSRF